MAGKKNITYNYLTAFILIIVLPILIISFLVNRFYLNTLQKNASDRILETMQQIAIGLNDEGKRVSLLTATIANDEEVVELATNWRHSADTAKKLYYARQIDSKLNYLFNYNSDIQAVIFFFRDGGCYYYKNPALIDEAQIREMKDFKEALRNKGRVVLAGSLRSFVYNSFNYVISGWVESEIPAFRSDVEAVYAAFNSNVINGLFSNTEFGRIGEMLVIDQQGRIIAANNRKLIGSNIKKTGDFKRIIQAGNHSFTMKRNRQKLFVTSYLIQKTNWRLVNMVDYRVLTNNVDKVWRYVTVVFGLFIILFFAFTLFFFRDIILPINHLIKQMRRVEQGDFNASIRVKGNDEIFQLGQSFNKMVVEIKNLMKERDLKEKERSQAELEALKSQINPHFISNTLNSIRLMAMIAKIDSIKNMTEAFMKLLAASFSKDEALSMVDQEIENLENYIHIMKVRYGDQFDVVFDIPDDVRNGRILKLILQPILENAILHGVSDLAEKGLIKINGRRGENHLLFVISDNGVGMSSEQIKMLLTECRPNPKGFNSIGIKNVDRRIKLNHGESYGLTIASVPGSYTRVEILLPWIPDEGVAGE